MWCFSFWSPFTKRGSPKKGQSYTRPGGTPTAQVPEALRKGSFFVRGYSTKVLTTQMDIRILDAEMGQDLESQHGVFGFSGIFF